MAESLSELTQEELELWIGEELGKKTFGNKPSNSHQKKELARRWFLTNSKKYKEKICANNSVHKFRTDGETKNLTGLAAALADIVGSQVGGIPVFAFTLMLTYYGLNKLCKNG